MRAALLTAYGEPSVLREIETDDPVAGPGEVLVELKAAALNRRDTYLRRGAIPTYRFPLPLVLGSDGAGVRCDTGEEVVVFPMLGWGEREEAPAPGYGILGGPSNGTYAELVAVPAENVYPRPAGLSWHEAAALPLAGLTAYRALFSRGGVRAGETVLVLGAGSGVSTFAVSLAAQAGARVLVTSSSAEKIDRARALGAERGFDYTAGDWPAEITAYADGIGVDVVVDSVGLTWPDSLRCLRPGGRLVVFGATAGADVALQARAVYFGQYSILGTTMGSPRDFEGLLRMVADGSWVPVVDSVRPLADAAAAHARIEAGAHFGKLVLEI
jgi:NADPH:quinone reductase-like Zn-dependent oxidoreductase